MTRVQPDASWRYFCGKGNDDGRPYVVQIDADGNLITASTTVDAENVTYTPAVVADWNGGVDPGNQNDANDQLAERTKDLENLLPYTSYPTRASIILDECTTLTGTALGAVHDAARDYAVYATQNPAANGDEFTWSWVLAAGSYTLYLKGSTANVTAIHKVGAKHTSEAGYTDYVTGIDWYSAGSVVNVVKSGALTLPLSGRYTFKSTVTGKNASSGGYFTSLTKLWIKPTAD